MTHSLSLRPRALAEVEAGRDQYALIGHGDLFLDGVRSYPSDAAALPDHRRQDSSCAVAPVSIAKLPGGAPITQARDDRSHAAYTNEARNPGVDGTNLSYVGTQPPGAPSTLMRGQVVDLGMMSSDFEVTSDLPFQIATYQVGNTIIDPSLAGKGDPSQSTVAAVEQFRKKYVFLAPNDYDVRR